MNKKPDAFIDEKEESIRVFVFNIDEYYFDFLARRLVIGKAKKFYTFAFSVILANSLFELINNETGESTLCFSTLK